MHAPKRIRLLATMLAVLMLSAPVAASATNPIQDPGIGPNIPEPPEKARRFNYTEVVPEAFRHSYAIGEPLVFRFRNMTMQFNASRSMELNITADPRLEMRYFSLDLQLSRSLMLSLHANSTPPPSIPRPESGIDRYLILEPNASAQIRATLRLYIDEEGLSVETNKTIRRERLTWCWWNASDWEAVDSWVDEGGFLVAETDHLSTWTIRERGRPEEIPAPDIPGVPSRVRAYNHSDATPDRFEWTVRAREGAVLVFRNMAMMFNSTKDLELNITSGPNVVQRLFRLQLNPAEALRLRIRMQVEPPSGVGQAQRGVGLYLDVEPNSTAPVNARIGLLIDPVALQAHLGREVNASALRWAYWNGSVWVDVESTLDEDNILEAETDHFSTWTIIELEETQEPEPLQDQETSETHWYLLGGLIIVGAVAIILVLRRS